MFERMQQLDAWTNSVIAQVELLPLVPQTSDFGDHNESITAQSIRAISRIKLCRSVNTYSTAKPPTNQTQCPNQNTSLPSILRHPPLHQKALRPYIRHPKHQQPPKARHPQRLLPLQHSRFLPKSRLIRIHDPLRLLHLLRYPSRPHILRSPLSPVSIRLWLPIQHPTIWQNLPPGFPFNLPYLPQPANSPASF